MTLFLILLSLIWIPARQVVGPLTVPPMNGRPLDPNHAVPMDYG
jgi:hypothetical protein